MTNCTTEGIQFPACKRRRVEAGFSGGNVSSDGGVLLLRQADRLTGLTKRVAEGLKDPRRKASCDHTLRDLLRQRVYAIALGYEDLNDHDSLRKDLAIQTGVGRDVELASKSTLCRFENSQDRDTAWAINTELIETFIRSHRQAPGELILDFDATDDPVHGEQSGRFFHGYYGHYCFLPLYVFCADQVLVSYLRPSNIDASKHTLAILSLLVRRLRRQWPDVKIIFRGDSGFCRDKILSWCERQDKVFFIVGLAKNSRLLTFGDSLIRESAARFKRNGSKQRLFGEFQYAAATWKRERAVIIKAEHGPKGSNPRFVVTNITDDPGWLYDALYCARGEMENRIKEQQLCMFADRTSCHDWWANQFRLLLSSMAYTLVETIRRLGLSGTELQEAQCDTIRLRLLKIGAVILRNTRRVRFHLSSAYPWKSLFFAVHARLCAG
ncbi:MAG: IS1380 family transposase [Pseudomonadota bacterium]